MKKLLIPLLAAGLLLPLQADDTPLAEAMDAMNDVYKTIRRADDLVAIAPQAREAQEAVLRAISMTPAYVEAGSHPEPKEKAMAIYRKQVGQLYVLWCDMELALLANDKAKVDEIVELMKESKKTGHDEFMDE